MTETKPNQTKNTSMLIGHVRASLGVGRGGQANLPDNRLQINMSKIMCTKIVSANCRSCNLFIEVCEKIHIAIFNSIKPFIPRKDNYPECESGVSGSFLFVTPTFPPKDSHCSQRSEKVKKVYSDLLMGENAK